MKSDHAPPLGAGGHPALHHEHPARSRCRAQPMELAGLAADGEDKVVEHKVADRAEGAGIAGGRRGVVAVGRLRSSQGPLWKC